MADPSDICACALVCADGSRRQQLEPSTVGGKVGAGLEAATHAAKGRWGKPTLVLRGVELLALSSGLEGQLLGLWGGGVPGPLFEGKPRQMGVIDASIQPAQGNWQTPQAISPPGSEDEAALGMAANGQATAIWVLRPPPEHTETIETSDYQPELPPGDRLTG